MNILVTGAGGFIGRRLVERLAREGHAVVAVDRAIPRSILPSGVRSVVSDLTAARAVFSVITGPFVLVHLAWEMDRSKDQALQVKCFADLLDAAARSGLARAVALGSSEEYGSRGGVLREQDAPVPPLTPYGAAKRAARDVLKSFSEKCGVPALWLRPFTVYGPGQQGNMMIPYAVRCAEEGTKAQFTDGQQSRDFIYVDDVADALAKAVTLEHSGFNEINIASGGAVRVRDVLGLIAEAMNSKDLFQIGALPRRAGEPELQQADIRAAESLLGWQPVTTLREGIAETCRASGSHKRISEKKYRAETQGRRDMIENEIGTMVVECAIAVHRETGPGLLESVYETILARELELRGLAVKRQVPIPIRYKDMRFDEGFRADIMVNNAVILELKSVERVPLAHKKQLQTYLRLTGCRLGYLLNFGAALMKDGITRCVNGLPE